jgi:hypothetical protein
MPQCHFVRHKSWDFTRVSSLISHLPLNYLPRPIQPAVQYVPGSFLGGKAAGAWRWPPTLSRSEVKNQLPLLLGRDNVVGIATRYGLDGPGIERRWGRDFEHPSRPALGPIQLPVNRVQGLFLRSKAAGSWRWPPAPDVKERVALHLYSLSGPSWPVLYIFTVAFRIILLS